MKQSTFLEKTITELKQLYSPLNFILSQKTRLSLFKKIFFRPLKSLFGVQAHFNKKVIKALEEIEAKMDSTPTFLQTKDSLGTKVKILEKKLSQFESVMPAIHAQHWSLFERINNLETNMFNVNYINDAHGAKSFSQFGEDVWIRNNIELPKKGFFLDIGAADGTTYSNTYFFELIGWDGICLEPNPVSYQKAKIIRKKVLPYAISTNNGVADLFIPNWSADWSGLKSSNQTDTRVRVKTITLNSLVKKYNITNIDILSVDTEGTEIDVLRSLNFSKIKPKVIIVEYLTRESQDQSLKIKKFFDGVGDYKLKHRTTANLIFVLNK